MKEYKKPICTLLRIVTGATMISGSNMDGGGIDDKPTNYFDAKRQSLIDFDDDFDD